MLETFLRKIFKHLKTVKEKIGQNFSNWIVSELEIMRNVFFCEMTKVASDVVGRQSSSTLV